MARTSTTAVRRACASFGLTPGECRRCADPGRAAAAGARRVDAALAPGCLALVTGASGSGKSSLLRALRGRVRARAGAVVSVDPAALLRAGAGRAALELLRCGVERGLRLLARAGLADATVPALRPRELSEGQRWRLALAVAMRRTEDARRPVTLLVDELGASLDRETAASVAVSLAKWVRRGATTVAALGDSRARQPLVRAVCATPRHLASSLSPDLLVRVGAGAAAIQRCAPRAARALPLRISRGTMAEYGALARLHYRAGAPATVELILAARTRRGELAGVLVVSRPTLNGAWREIAWPGRYRSGSPRVDAARLNAQVRTISRVIVEPRFRARGVARRLVRAYLCRPLTPCTEAVAAMGACSPFFAGAGMTEYRLPPTRRDARLADALHASGFEPLDLLREIPPAPAVRSAFLRRELRVWANGAGATRPLLRAAFARLARAAALALCTPRHAYAHTKGGPR